MRKEPTGWATLTPAFSPPSRNVLHAVGPIVRGHVTQQDRMLLTLRYCACQDLTQRYGLHGVAFCGISTGEFNFPNELAVYVLETHLKK